MFIEFVHERTCLRYSLVKNSFALHYFGINIFMFYFRSLVFLEKQKGE